MTDPKPQSILQPMANFGLEEILRYLTEMSTIAGLTLRLRAPNKQNNSKPEK